MSPHILDNSFQGIFLYGIMVGNTDMMLAFPYSRYPDMTACLAGFLIPIVLFQKLY